MLIELNKYQELYDEVRKILIEHSLQFANYMQRKAILPTKEKVRRLHNLVYKSERMQLDLLNLLKFSKEICIIRKTILQTIRDDKAYLALFDIYLKEKYQILGDLTNVKLLEAHISSLYNNIETKNNHERLYEAKKNEQVDINGSSMWLHKGNLKALDEAKICYIRKSFR